MISLLIKTGSGKFEKKYNLQNIAYMEFVQIRLKKLYPDFLFVNCYKDGKQFGSITQRSFPMVIPFLQKNITVKAKK